MAIRYSNGKYLCEFQQGGVRILRRLPAGITQAQAKEYETKLRRELFDRDKLGKKPDLTLTDAIGRWLLDNDRKNKKKAQSEAKQWEPWVRGKLLRQAPEVAQSATTAWTQLSDSAPSTGTNNHVKPATSKGVNLRPRWRKAAAATINRRLALLKAVCHHAYKQGWIEQNLSGRITLLKERNKREVYLSKQQVMSLRDALNLPEARTATMLAAYTGLRASELLALQKDSVHGDTLRVAPGKTSKPRLVPVAKTIKPLLSRLPLELSYWQWHKDFLRARKAIGMPHLRIHDLRHTCASWLINAGVDLYTVGKILGHSGPQTTARYAHLADATLKKAMARLR
jgi:Site-specific recombinase XerD